MMKSSNLLFLFFPLLGCSLFGNNVVRYNVPPKDTMKVVDIEEVFVYASPKENRKLRQQALSVSLLSKQDLQMNRINSMKDLTSFVPNLYIPDYGSKLTSSIYIRGIGSRINSSAVGVYVDNIPMYDKSAFDFDYADIDRIDVLRGPQGTLYGRNAMGGLINIHTKSPFSYNGTDLLISGATRNNYRLSLTHYHRINNKFAFSAGGFLNHDGGFFTNRYNGYKIDKGYSGGGRFHAIYLPSDKWKWDFNMNYEYSDYDGYPYGLYNKSTKVYTSPDYNFTSGYYRSLLNMGVTTVYTGKNFILNFVTAYQHLHDRMKMDQDFTEADLYTLTQKQKQHTLSEEINLKSKSDKRWQWTNGFSISYQWLNTNAPVGFGLDFISNLQSQMDAAMQAMHSPMTVTLEKSPMTVPGVFKTPTLSTALFHQSTYNNLFAIEGLSTTIGLRFDYEKVKIDYNTQAALNYVMKMPGAGQTSGNYSAHYLGSESNGYFHVLPKMALKYDFNKTNNIYAQLSRGSRSGGYNIQMLSDYLANDLQKNVGTVENRADINAALKYKPEYSWNYEIGSHLTLINDKLWTDGTVFYMDTRNQQIARFAEGGLGRYTTNAGKSRSYGAELSVRANITDAFNMSINYGYTNVTFRKYISNVQSYVNGKMVLTDVDYSGKFVPFSPKHTLNVAAQYIFRLTNSSLIKDITLYADYSGIGRIYWTEMNDVSQKFYGLFNARMSASIGNHLQVDIWGKNIFNKDYAVFYFENTSGCMQKGRPVQGGVDFRFKF